MTGRTGNRELAEVAASISERDLNVVRVVFDFRMATGGQLRRLYFPLQDESTARACRRSLERLTQLNLVRRLHRRVGGVRAGSASFIYVIGPVGERLLQRDAPRRRLREPSWSFVDHTLHVLEMFVLITEHSRRAPSAEVVEVQTEPAAWRSHRALGASVDLRPDLFISLGVDDTELRWFIEIDRGTEHLPAVMRKSAAYDRYYGAGVEQARHGVFPRVMWATTTTARADRIARQLAASALTTDLFRVDTLERAVIRVFGEQQ